MLSARIAAIVGLVLLLGHLGLMARSLREARETILVSEKMRKLATLVIQNFPERKDLNDKAFWKGIGRTNDPIRDSWGEEYLLESGGLGDFYWRSSGPDRVRGTADDLIVKVPFVDGPGPDLGPPEGNTGFPGTDAK